jgi:hypothetical protein
MKLKFPPLRKRLLTALGGKGTPAERNTDRLRDVLGRDRALAVGARAEPGRGRPASAPPALTVVPAPAPATPSTAELAAALTAEERPQRVKHEPIRTRTMARLLAAQGYRQRALAIYEELLAEAGADDALRAEAEALRTRAS